MEKIEIIQKGDVYSCDIGISKQEWLDILKDTMMPDQYKEALIKVFYAPNHRGTCTAICNELGGNPRALNLYIAKCGEYVQKKLGRFQIVRNSGKPCYWLVPMVEGKDLPPGSEGTFEWQLRPELVEAIRDYLYWFFFFFYKNVRKNIRIDDDNWYEVYKWKLVTACQGKDYVSIVDKLRVTNLVYTVMASPTLDFVIKNHREELEKVVEALIDGDVPLEKRIQTFTDTMRKVADDPNNDKQNFFVNDERTASAILTCIEPNNYTIYKFELYKMLCHYLNIPTQSTACYVDYLKLIGPLRSMIEKDEALHELVAPSLDGLIKSDMLLAQDVLWVLFVSFPRQLGFIHPLLWRPRYWYVGHTYGGTDSQLSRFVNEGIWEGKFSEIKSEDQRQLNVTKKIKKGDVVILKSSFTKGTDHNIPCIRLFALGEVTEDEHTIKKEGEVATVSYKVNYFSQEAIDFEGKKYGKYRKTIDECKDKEIISYVNTVKYSKPKMKYGKYIELLEQNKNMILTGAPGTGKTFMAKAIAEEMNAECEFVQFHPSYDYTDFVEGLRPVGDSRNFGFELRNGVFKEFCAKALQNLIDSQKSIQALQQETSARNKLDDFIEEAIDEEREFKTSGTKNIFHIIENKDRTIVVEVPANEKTSLLKISKSDIINLMEKNAIIKGGKDIQKFINRKYRAQQDSYIYVLYNIIKNLESKPKKLDVSLIELKKFVFIIDEINRGDLSKIFGELFFSIDPGYRGETGRVNTQYQNMIEDDDVFKKGFFVPENVYIIGTMNDIDRSVESMDFAMRRRFIWEEVTPADTESMLDTLSCAKEAKETMGRLNNAIKETEGLGTAYMIGPSYFLKLGENGDDFSKLWKMSIRPLLNEYLRGFRKANEILEKFRKVYFDGKEGKIEETPELIDED